MCKPVVCEVCLLVSWVGCGLHVGQALLGVEVSGRCLGHEGVNVF